MDSSAEAGVRVNISNSAYRASLPAVQWAVLGLGVGISVFHLLANTVLTVAIFWQNGLHYSLFALMCAIVMPMVQADGSVRRERLLLALDVTIGLLVVAATVFLFSREDAIYRRGVSLAPMEWAAALFLMASAIEFTRRTTGWIIPILIVLGLLYVSGAGQYIGGVFTFAGLSFETVTFRSIFGDDGLFGTIALISSTYVFLFLLFGAFLLRSGAGEFVIDLARAAAGRMIGGPGLVAVIASSLTGTISGSAVANTATTGVITIPLMKRSGFPARFAAGVEAGASTGGQLMPPIMGAGAFVMASYTQIPYTTIVAVSVLPAVLYFASVGFYVRAEARRQNIDLLDEDAPRFKDVLKRGGVTFLVPITVLIGLLIYGFTPTYAACASIAAVVVSSWLTRHPMGPRAVVEARALGARNMIMTAILLCSVGLVVNVISMTGIGNTFSLLITTWAGNSALIAIVLIALASLVLGMGLPVTAAYIVLGTLSAPALAQLLSDVHLVQVLADGSLPAAVRPILTLASPETAAALMEGAPLDEVRRIVDELPVQIRTLLKEELVDETLLTYALLSAHLIVFWLSQDSNVTPPVCLAAFTAAGIAGSPQMATGFTAWKIAKGLYIVPLLIAYTPLVSGNVMQALFVFAVALPGIWALTGAMQGYLWGPLSWVGRLAAGLAGTIIVWPGSLWYSAVGGALVIAVCVLSGRGVRPVAGQLPAT